MAFAGKTKDVNGNAVVFSNVTDKVANYTDANIAAINNLGAQVTGVGFSDTVDNLNTAKTQLLTWMAGVLKSYNLSLNLPDGTVLQSFTTDGQTLTINAANAAGFANKGLNFSLKIQDTTANLNAVNLHALASLGSQLVSIFDNDGSQGASISQAISVADALVLAPKATGSWSNIWGTYPYSLNFSNVTDSITNIVTNASQLKGIASLITLNINDTAANINTNYAKLLAIGSSGLGFTVPDSKALSGFVYLGGSSNGSAWVVNAATAITASQDGLTLPLRVQDTTANLNAVNLHALASLGSQLVSIFDNDGSQGASISQAISVADALVLAPKATGSWSNIWGTYPYSLNFSNVTDTAANIANNANKLSALGSQISVNVTDTVANINANQTALSSLTSLKTINLPDGTSFQVGFTVNVAGALGVNAHGLTISFFKVQDTSVNLATNWDALAKLGSPLISVQNTDSGVTAITAALNVADTLILAPKSLNSTGGLMSFANVTDSAANIATNAAKLAAFGNQLAINVSDSAAKINANQLSLLSLGTALKSINLPDGNVINLNVNASGFYVIAHDAVKLAQEGITFPVNVVDTDANIFANADALAKLGVQIHSITDTSAANTLPTAINAVDALVLAPKLVDINGVHAVFGNLTDTAADVANNLDKLQAIANQITSIKLTDSGTPSLNITATQLSVGGDAQTLGLISGNYSLTVSGATVANFSNSLSNTHVTSVGIVDSATNILTGLDNLQANAAKLSAITFTDSNTPTLAITATQFANDTAAFGLITGQYNITVTNVSVANMNSTLVNALSVTLKDSAVKLLAGLDSVQAANGHITDIKLTDIGAPAFSVTATQFNNDYSTLNLISSNYRLTIQGSIAANVASKLGNSHWAAVAVADSGVNVVTNLDALQAHTTNISGISLTDTSTPKLAITASQLTNDSAALGLISNTYNLAVSGVSAANVSSVLTKAHVASVSISDTAAATVTNLSSLQTNVAKITGITLTDTGTPTLSLTAATVSSAQSVLNDIQTNYLLSVKDTVSNINKLDLSGLHTTSIEIQPTGLVVGQNLQENTKVTNLNLSLINLTGDSINEKVYNTTGTEIDILNSSSAIISKFIFTHDTEAQLHLIGVGSTPVHLI